MEQILLIGDVHGKLNDYLNIIRKTELNTIQVGDFGFKREHDWFIKNIDSDKHKINFGNHDDYRYINHKHSLGKYSIIQDLGIMTISGANSIDKEYRTEGRDWFPDEELSYKEMNKAIDLYEEYYPRIVISHDCPQIIRTKLFGINEYSLTSKGLDEMFEIQQPDYWIFGHHHRSRNFEYNNTKFICLNELETLLLDL